MITLNLSIQCSYSAHFYSIMSRPSIINLCLLLTNKKTKLDLHEDKSRIMIDKISRSKVETEM